MEVLIGCLPIHNAAQHTGLSETQRLTHVRKVGGADGGCDSSLATDFRVFP